MKKDATGLIIVLIVVVGIFQAAIDWIKKNPGLALAFASIFIVVAVVYFVSADKKYKKQLEQREIDKRRRQAEAQSREQAQANQMIYNRLLQVINESIAIAKTTKNSETRLSRIDVAISTSESLLEQYPDDVESRNLYGQLIAIRPQLHLEAFEEALEKHMIKARSMKTLKSKINNAEKALVEVESAYLDPYIDKNTVDHYKQAINQFLTDIQVNDFAEKARKYEFKGQYSKAADSYLDALFHIKNDAIDDELQAEQILEIERLANDLRQRAKENN